jgi:hypothetical protein
VLRALIGRRCLVGGNGRRLLDAKARAASAWGITLPFRSEAGGSLPTRVLDRGVEENDADGDGQRNRANVAAFEGMPRLVHSADAPTSGNP